MASITNLIPDSVFKEIADRLGVSAVVALRRLDKIVTGKTARSVRTEMSRKPDSVEISLIGGEGMKYIIEGKPANTKYPVKKVGDKFELVDSLKDWKNIRGFQGSDFLLARQIAENSRDPVDVAGATLDVYEELYSEDFNSKILNLTAMELGKQIIKQSE